MPPSTDAEVSALKDSAEVVVIGGGVIGCSIAYYLAKRGVRDTLLLERRGLASGPTGVSSAIVRQHYANAALARMACESLAVFQQFPSVVGGDSGFRQVGYLFLVGEQDVAALEDNVALQRSVGVHVKLLSPADVADLEPGLNVGDVARAAYEPEAGYADPAATTYAFAAAARSMGATISPFTHVERILVRGDRVVGVQAEGVSIAAPVVVLAAGPWSVSLAQSVGIALPMEGWRDTVAVFEAPCAGGLARCVVSDRITGHYFRPEGDRLMLVSSSDPGQGEPEHDPDARRQADLKRMTNCAEALSCRFAAGPDSRLVRGFTGVYDVTPDRQPLLGALAIEGLFCACGFSGHGFKLAPAVGQAMAEYICEGRSARFDLHTFRPSRFQEGEPVRPHRQYSSQYLA